jgi:two-component system, OmpR family, response regulator
MSLTQRLNLLVVEDRADDAAALLAVLTPDGYSVRIAPDGEAALSAIIADPPDAILLDLGLPKLGGLDVASALRSIAWRRRPLVVAVTGHGDDEHRARAAAAGIDLFMSKPVDPEAVRATLRGFLAGGRSAARKSAPPAARLAS